LFCFVLMGHIFPFPMFSPHSLIVNDTLWSQLASDTQWTAIQLIDIQSFKQIMQIQNFDMFRFQRHLSVQ
jgi:phosphoglycerol transferase MdoB-like AlkP superfamily enzyme